MSKYKNRFATVPSTNIQRSTFDRSHKHITTFNEDVLVPVLVDEVYPSDTVKMKMSGFVRMATPIYPLLDNLYLDTFSFFIPTRILWDNWKKFNGERVNPDDSIDYTIPTRTTSLTPTTGSLMDYMGIPIGVNAAATGFNVLPLRAYWKIFNDWFRDQNLQNTAGISTGDSESVLVSGGYNWMELAVRGKRHDYFTSSLPWPQKGDSVSTPLSGSALIYTDADDLDDAVVYSTTASANRKLTASATYVQIASTTGVNTDRLYADMEGVTGVPINTLRQSFQIQKLLERDARSGTRYVEMVHAHFGVRDAGGDARMQRPEYLGGSSDVVRITPIAQTSSTDATTPQGNLAAMGTIQVKSGWVKSFTEHGYIITLVNVRADLTYQQGLERLWSRQTRYDFYYPVLAHIGEQAVLNKEIYLQGTSVDEEVFGYQERFAELRYAQNRVSGLFRSTAAGTLDPWHVAQEFDSLPVLGPDFIKSNTPINRVVAVPDEPSFIGEFYFNAKWTRPMPLHGVPGLIDHF